VVSLVGAIPASNYVEMPTKKSCIKSLGLSGKYVYIQFQFYKKKFFNIHLDF
jgi:hypothetical protein